MMVRSRLFFVFNILLISILTVGCQTIDKIKEEPFIFSFKNDSMEDENNEILNEWLLNARMNQIFIVLIWVMATNITMQGDIVMW